MSKMAALITSAILTRRRLSIEAFYCKNTQNLIIDNWSRELTCYGDDFASKYDHENLFDGCQGTTIRNAWLAKGDSNVTGLKAILCLNDCKGFILDNCLLPGAYFTTVHDYIVNPSTCLYLLGATPSNGIEFRNCILAPNTVISYSGSPIAKVTNPGFSGAGASGGPQTIALPTSVLEYGAPLTEFCTNPIFATNPSSSQTGCTAARDATVVYRGTNSWKITMSGNDGDKHASQLNSFFTTTTGTKYGLFTAIYKADTDMNITFTLMGGQYELLKGINVTGDSKWRAVVSVSSISATWIRPPWKFRPPRAQGISGLARSAGITLITLPNSCNTSARFRISKMGAH